MGAARGVVNRHRSFNIHHYTPAYVCKVFRVARQGRSSGHSTAQREIFSRNSASYACNPLLGIRLLQISQSALKRRANACPSVIYPSSLHLPFQPAPVKSLHLNSYPSLLLSSAFSPLSNTLYRTNMLFSPHYLACSSSTATANKRFFPCT